MAGHWISSFVRTLYYCLILWHAPCKRYAQSMQTYAANARGEFQIQPSTSRVTAYDSTEHTPYTMFTYSVLFQGTIAKKVIGKADRHVIVSTSCIERT